MTILRDLIEELEKLERLPELEAALEKTRARMISAEERYENLLWMKKKADLEHDSQIENYKGAIRRYENENHVLYHKISTLIGYRNTTDYDSARNDKQNRENLQRMLDQIKPTNITFGPDGEPFSLLEHGTMAGMGVDYAEGRYLEPPLVFC